MKSSNNDAYTSFARVYDTFMDNVPYEEWAEYIVNRLQENNINSGRLEDLGCGSGKLSRILAAKGYSVTAIDSSADMLTQAEANTDHEELNICYVCQDITQLDVPGDTDAIISTCDTLNYILEWEDIKTTFESIYDSLKEGGIFFFDFNTRYKYEELIGDTTIAEDRDEAAFIWDNEFLSEEDINIYELTLFIREKDDLYRKYQETHYQRGYDIEEMKQLLYETGFEILKITDDYSDVPASCETGRVCVTVVKKRG